MSSSDNWLNKSGWQDSEGAPHTHYNAAVLPLVVSCNGRFGVKLPDCVCVCVCLIGSDLFVRSQCLFVESINQSTNQGFFLLLHCNQQHVCRSYLQRHRVEADSLHYSTHRLRQWPIMSFLNRAVSARSWQWRVLHRISSVSISMRVDVSGMIYFVKEIDKLQRAATYWKLKLNFLSFTYIVDDLCSQVKCECKFVCCFRCKYFYFYLFFSVYSYRCCGDCFCILSLI